MAQVDWWVGGGSELAMAVPCEAVSTRPLCSARTALCMTIQQNEREGWSQL